MFPLTPTFAHDLHFVSLPGKHQRTMVCFHGYGANYRIIESIQQTGLVDATLVGFNFPDHDLLERPDAQQELSFGTIQELLPALAVLRHCVIHGHLDAIDVYGFSAGAAALVNVLGVLNSTIYDGELKTIGIAHEEKAKILHAVQQGIVILDAPLKSIEEIIDARGTSLELEMLARQYQEHHFRPLDSIALLKGIVLNVWVYFETPDEVVYNRDDAMFIERLKQVNLLGQTKVITGSNGGHAAIHWELWQFYDLYTKGGTQ